MQRVNWNFNHLKYNHGATRSNNYTTISINNTKTNCTYNNTTKYTKSNNISNSTNNTAHNIKGCEGREQRNQEQEKSGSQT